MALQTPAAVERDFLLRRGQLMRVVTRNTTEPTLALLKTAAQSHLVDMPDRFLAAHILGQPDKYGFDQVQRQSRAVVEQRSPAAHHARFTLKMALLANGFAQRRLQMARVHDGEIAAVRRLATQ